MVYQIWLSNPINFSERGYTFDGNINFYSYLKRDSIGAQLYYPTFAMVF